MAGGETINCDVYVTPSGKPDWADKFLQAFSNIYPSGIYNLPVPMDGE